MKSIELNDENVVLTLSSNEISTICTAICHLCADCVINDLPLLYSKAFKLNKQIFASIR